MNTQKTTTQLSKTVTNNMLLSDIAECYNIDTEDLLNRINDMKKQQIINQHPYAIFQGNGKDKRWRTYITDETKEEGRRPISKSSLEALHDTIISEYRKRVTKENLADMNLEKVYNEWVIWRRDTGTDPNTIKKNLSDWNRFIKGNALAEYKVIDITTSNLEDFFLHITKNHAITTKQLSNVRTVLSGIFKHAVRLGIINHSIVFDIDYQQFRKNRCMPSVSKKKAYSDDERKAILDFLEDKTDVYSLAISFAFRLCLRIGELQVLQKSDVKGDTLRVERSVRRNQKMNDDFTFSEITYKIDERNKGNTEDGIRTVTLSNKAQETAKKAIKLYPDGEFLFMQNGRHILGSMFNRHLKRVCSALDIPYRASHQIRFTTATNLAEAGVPINQLSYELGHSDVRTTFNYVRQRKLDDRSKSIVAQIQDI